jgi:hypothetical protein
MRDAAGAKEALKVPHLTHRAALHVEAGERFTEFLRKHRTGFLRESGFDKNILSKLRAATDELRGQTAFATTSRRERSALIREIKPRLKNGRHQIDLLSNILEPLLIERKLVGAWAQAIRVGVKKGRHRDTPEQRAEKRLEAAKLQKERLAEQRARREQKKADRRAKRAASPAPPPTGQAPIEQPLTKEVFRELLAEEVGEIER